MNPMTPGGLPPGAPPPGSPPYGYAPQGAQPGYAPQPGAPMQPSPGMPMNAGVGLARLGHAQASLNSAGSMLKYMQIGFAALGGLLAVGGLVAIVTGNFGMGIGLVITGVVLGGTAWFTLPMFMGQLSGAQAMVGALAAKEQLALTGMPMTARVLAAQQTGTMVNMNPQVHVTLEVHGPQGPYHVQTLAIVPQFNIPQCQPGATVNVRVNPQNPHEVAVVF